MYQQAVGFTPGKSLLSGLSKKPNVGAYGKGLGMEAAADMGLAREQQNQKFASQQMANDSRQRMAEAQNNAARAGNAVQERTAAGNLASQRQQFNTNMAFDYGALRKRQSLNLQQALLNGMARDF